MKSQSLARLAFYEQRRTLRTIRRLSATLRPWRRRRSVSRPACSYRVGLGVLPAEESRTIP